MDRDSSASASGRAALKTLAVAAAGGALVAAGGVTAGWLIGASAASAAAALNWRRLGFRPAMPDTLRDAAFLLLGASAGAGFSPEVIDQMALAWPVLVLMSLCVLAIIAGNAWMLTRLFGMDAASAVAGSAPGALSMALALADGGFGSPARVMILQSVRLLVMVTAVPLALDAAGFGGVPTQAGGAPAAMTAVALGLILAAGLGLAALLAAGRVPAPHFFAGLIASAASHGGGWLSGAVPADLVAASFVLVGAHAGLRFSDVGGRDMLRTGFAALAATLLSLAVALAFALAAARLFPMGQEAMVLAFAPGAIEAMAALAIAFGTAPAFVAACHLWRITFIMLAVPLIARMVAARLHASPQNPPHPTSRP